MARSYSVLSLLALSAMTANPALAAIINVPGDAPTIQAAINLGANGDEIVVSPGTYREAINFNGKSLTLRSTGGAAATIIDGENRPVNVITANGSTTVRVEGFTIRGGRWSGLGETPGGGMLINGATATVVNCVFTSNVSYAGGGIGISNGTLTVRDSVFHRNRGFFGSGIAAVGSRVRIEGSTFTSNGNVNNLGDGTGLGAVRAEGGGLTIINSSFSQNTGGSGAAVLTSNAEVLIDGVTAFGNGGTDVRGTLFTFDGGAMNFSGGTGVVRNSVFTANTASAGSALYFKSGANFTVVNNVFNDNVGGVFGAAIYAGDVTSPLIVNNTFANNENGAVVTRFFSNPTITNNVIWRESFNENDPMESVDVFGNGTGTISYTVLQGRFYIPIPGAGNVNAQPVFVDADGADNIAGTLDDNFALASGSPGVDAGNNNAVPAGLVTDLVGGERFSNDPATPDTGVGEGPIVDMGAFELQGAGRCTADMNRDGVVDFFDYLDFVQMFASESMRADIDGSGTIDFFDYLDFVALFNAGC
jgi:hypothetical protein